MALDLKKAFSYNAKGNAKVALTPGELDGMVNQGLYLSPSVKDYIPAYKGSGRQALPMTDAFNSEAEQLKDAQLDLRLNAKFERVFGNGLFEDVSSAGSPKGVKMNNLFSDGTNRSASVVTGKLTTQQDLPEKGGQGGGLAARRYGNKPLAPTHSSRQAEPEQGTEVHAFNDTEESSYPVVGRSLRTQPSSAHGQQSYATWEAQLKHLIASGRREEAVRMPAAPGRLVRCYVKRVKNFFSTHCCFQMFLDGSDIFLLAGRRRKKSKTSSYVVSLDLDDLKRDTDNCMAKLKANFVGTEYSLWGRQLLEGSGQHSPSQGSNASNSGVKKGYAREDLCINFKQTALTAKGGPRSMYVVVPLSNVDDSAAPTSMGAFDGSESLSHCLELARRRELAPFIERRLSFMVTKSPEWDGNLGAYTLDFQGRVKEASVKNFQLTTWDHNADKTTGDLLLQFGKQTEDVYALDFTYPFNIELAFSVALASLDTKLCYTI